RVHRTLGQQDEHRQGERVGRTPARHGALSSTRNELLDSEYPAPGTPCQVPVVRRSTRCVLQGERHRHHPAGRKGVQVRVSQSRPTCCSIRAASTSAPWTARSIRPPTKGTDALIVPWTVVMLP